MTEQEPRDTPTGRPGASRHRQSAAASMTAWRSGMRWRSGVRRPHRREVIAGGGVLALVLVLILGYAFLVFGYNTDDNRAGPTASTPPPGFPTGSGFPPGTSNSPGPGEYDPSTPSPATPGSPGEPPATDRPPDRGTAPEPRRVGPKSLAGFERLLARYCRERGHRTAVLLDGPDGNRTGGDWVCVRVVTFIRINLDEACRDAFGDGSQARRTRRSDSRTWRCYDA